MTVTVENTGIILTERRLAAFSGRFLPSGQSEAGSPAGKFLSEHPETVLTTGKPHSEHSETVSATGKPHSEHSETVLTTGKLLSDRTDTIFSHLFTYKTILS